MTQPTRLLSALLVAWTLVGCGSTIQQQSTAGSSVLPQGEELLQPTEQGGSPAGEVTPGGAPLPGQVGTPAAGGVLPSSGGAAPVAAPRRPGTTPAGAVSPGVRVTTPISLGIMGAGSANGAAAALGAEYSTTTTGSDVAKAMVRYYNKNGGIAGRKINAVSYTLEVTSSNYQTELQAACARFTQDNKVSAVISALANAYYATYEQCLAKAGVPDFAGTTGSTDDRDLATFPGLVTVTAPSTNRRMTALFDRFRESGFLTPKNKIGIVVEGCPYNLRAYDETIAPLAKRTDLTVMRRDISCINGFSDAAAAISAFGSAVLPFRSAGVDRVVFVSNFEGVGLLAFENNANSQDYKPEYALTSTSGGAALAAQFSEAQLQRMRGVGWAPALDIAKRVLASPSTKRCRAILASEGIVPASKADDLLDLVCDQFFLLEATLTATGGRAGLADLLGGLRRLGTSYISPFTLEGAADYSSRRDGPRRFAIWGYTTACRCMDYLTKAS